jgi:hypothetical protein
MEGPSARHPPYELRITKWGIAYSIFSILVLLAFYVGLGLLPIWVTLAQGPSGFDDGATFSSGVMHATGFFLAVASFFFVPTLYIFAMIFIVGSVKSAQPYAWTFTETSVHYRFPFRGWQQRPVRQLTRIILHDRSVKAGQSKANAASVRVGTDPGVILQFADGQTLAISLDRARQFGVSLPALHTQLCQLYPTPAHIRRAISQSAWDVSWSMPGPSDFPRTLQIPRMAVINGVLLTGFFIACALTVVLFVLWLMYDGEISTSEGLLFMGVIGGFCLGLAPLAFASMVHPRQPYKLVLTEDVIRFRYPLRDWRAWAVRDLRHITLRPVSQQVAYRTRRGRGWRTVTRYNLVLTFSEGRTLAISEERALQFGMSPQDLHVLFQRLYGTGFRSPDPQS